MSIRLRPVFTVFLVAAAIIGVSIAFIANASPYVSVSEARKTGATNVHLKGDLIKSSVKNDVKTHTLQFELKDENGEVLKVVHNGTPPQDMSQATEVVAIGSMKGDEFHSHKLLIKCPSKYEGTEKAKY